MKTKLLSIIIILFVFMNHQLSQAQDKPKASCCSLAATESFANLGKDNNFKMAHQEPRAYTYEGQAGEKVSFATPDGQQASGFLLKASEKSNKYLFVFHEWWGLNDNIKREAEQLHKDLGGKVNVLALDLYDGQIATNREEAAKYMQGLKTERAQAIIKGAVAYAGSEARIATIGWCLGGGWSLQAGLLAGKQTAGVVIYYGMPEEDVNRLKELQSDVLGIFAAQDKWITPAVAEKFKENMKKAGKKVKISSYDADHAFANPSNAKFDGDAAKKAYSESLAYLKKRLK